jgi:two-component sensor histidine kinase
MDRVPGIRRLILADRPRWASFCLAAGAVAAATALRWVIDRGEAGIPFVTYFPAVVLSALLLGWRWGTAVAVASGMIANRLFSPEPLLAAFSGRDVILVTLFALSCGVLIWTAETARRLVRQLEAAKQREALLNRELAHRVKNMIATVSAMAVLTARHSEPGSFAEALGGRLQTLKRATELLESGGVAPCDLYKVVETALAPFRSGSNFSVTGPSCELPRDSCVPLALALHELATNAAKYGALSVPEGRVTLVWTVGGEENRLRLAWREEGGPQVKQPDRTGMGTQLLRRQRGLDSVKVDYHPDGVCCEIAVEGVAPAAPGGKAA